MEGDDAGNKEDLRDYLRGPTVPPDDSITISINLATYLLSGIEHLEAKADLAHAASEKYNYYNNYYIEADLLQNQVIRETKSKADAFNHFNDAIAAKDECF